MLLGRVLDGPDAGRVVVLREVTRPLADLAASIELARSLAHPRLAKVLGVFYSGACPYLASEYVPGVSLTELNAALRKQRTALEPSTAVRLVRQGLEAAAAAQRLLYAVGGLPYTRCFYPDTIWVAERGQVLISEVNVAPRLNTDYGSRSEDEALARDVLTAGVELVQLISGKALTRETLPTVRDLLPEPLAAMIVRVFRQPEMVTGPEAWAMMLDSLPSSFIASERQVADELARVLHSILAVRRRNPGVSEAHERHGS